ncbi:MAG TPA: hypothetical protein VIV06_03225 [Candidatus Limnocylindrales bacterium]
MARTPTFGGSATSPFRGGGAGFGAFDVGPAPGTGGGAGSADPGREAALELQRTETEWQAGRIDNQSYLAALAAYQASLDPSTATYFNTQARIDSYTYSFARNEIVARLQNGQATWGELVAFDQQSLAGLNTASAEYNDRLGRLNDSQTGLFRFEERAVVSELQAGRMTYTQAEEWYRGAAAAFSGNFGLATEIADTLDSLHTKILDEQDSQIIRDWQDGRIPLASVLAYAAQVQATDPGGSRASQWAQNAEMAKGEAIKESLQYRYELTTEYAELQKFLATHAAPTGRSSTAKSTRTIYTGDPANPWRTVTTTSGKYLAPTRSEQEAWAALQPQIESAKARIKQIEGIVGQTPGGWVNDADMVAFLGEQQAKTVKGTPQWLQLQDAIDGYQQHAVTMKVLSQQGIKVFYPGLASEVSGDLSVGGTERPTGLSADQVRKLSIYDERIQTLQGLLAVATTPERQAQLQAKIAENEALKSTVAGAAHVTPQPPAAASTPSGSAGGGRSVGTGGGGTAVPSRSASPPPVPSSARPGPFMLITGQTDVRAGRGGYLTGDVNPVTGEPVVSSQRPSVVTSPVGLPVGMDARFFDKVYPAFMGAIMDGETKFTDPTTGAIYRIPDFAPDRLELVQTLDGLNITLKAESYDAKRGTAGEAAAAKAYEKSVASASTHLYWIFDTDSPGVVRDKSGKALTEPSVSAGPAIKATNPIALGNTLIDLTGTYVERERAAAEAAIERSDLTAAYAHLQNINRAVNANSSRVENIATYAASAVVAVKTVESQTGVAPPTEVAEDLTRLVNYQSEFEGWLADVDKVSAPIFGTATQPGVVRTAIVNGQRVVVRDSQGEVQLADGFARYLSPSGKIEIKQSGGTNSLGEPLKRKDETAVNVVMNGKVLTGVIAPYDIDVVGQAFVAAPGGGRQPVNVIGKIVSITNPTTGRVEQWAENPLSPGVFLPMGPKGLPFQLPSGATAQPLPSQMGGGIGIAFTIRGDMVGAGRAGGAPGATGNYVLQPDAATGTYQLLEDRGTLGLVPVPDAGTILQMAGIGLDGASFTSDQKKIASLFSSGLLAPNVYLGASATDLERLASSGPRGQQLASLTRGFVSGLVSAAQGLPAWLAGNDPFASKTPYVSPDVGFTLPRPQAPSAVQTPNVNPYVGVTMPPVARTPVVNPYVGVTTSFAPIATPRIVPTRSAPTPTTPPLRTATGPTNIDRPTTTPTRTPAPVPTPKPAPARTTTPSNPRTSTRPTPL